MSPSPQIRREMLLPIPPGGRPTPPLLERVRVRVRGPLTQRQLAALLGVRQQTVNATERRALAKLRRALAREIESGHLKEA